MAKLGLRHGQQQPPVQNTDSEVPAKGGQDKDKAKRQKELHRLMGQLKMIWDPSYRWGQATREKTAQQLLREFGKKAEQHPAQMTEFLKNNPEAFNILVQLLQRGNTTVTPAVR